MKVLIIGDIRGLSDAEVDNKFKAATNDIKKIFEDSETASVRRTEYCGKDANLFYLGCNAQQLFETDAVYFIPGWENDPECALIEKVCAQYGIQRVEPTS